MTQINPVNTFGKDHWSLLAYVGYRAANHEGNLSNSHLRSKHPAIKTNPLIFYHWKPEYGTRLFGYWNTDGTTNPRLRLLDHDDHDCLEDLEAAGFITEVGTIVNPSAKLTDEGARVCGLLAKHKSDGHQYATFVLV